MVQQVSGGLEAMSGFTDLINHCQRAFRARIVAGLGKEQEIGFRLRDGYIERKSDGSQPRDARPRQKL